MKMRRMLSGGLRVGLLSGVMLAAAAPAANAALSWNPPSADFGSQNVGSTSAPRTFTLLASCDAGGGPLGVDCVVPADGRHNFGPPAVTGAGFAIVPGTNSCAAGVVLTPFFPMQNACSTQVTFAPTSGGAVTGSLATPNGPDVALSGTGVASPGAAPGETPKKKCKKGKKGKQRSAGAAKKKKCKRKKK